VCSALANGALWTHWSSLAHSANAWEIAEFIRARSDALFGTESAADIAVLHSASSYFVHSGGFLSTKIGNKPVWAAAAILWQGGYHFDVVGEHALPSRLQRYRLVILANQTHLDPDTLTALREFVRKGGRLLVAGRSALGDGQTSSLADVLGIEPEARLDPSGSLCVPAEPGILHAEDRPYGADIFVISLATECVGVRPKGCEVVVGRMTAKTTSGQDHAGPSGWLWRGHGLEEDRSRPVLCRHAFGRGEAWYLAADLFAHYDYTKFFGSRTSPCPGSNGSIHRLWSARAERSRWSARSAGRGARTSATS